MTRPKVPDDKRQRTAQACETCKRRKQKCNGLQPCSACIKRSSPCTYKSETAVDPAPPQKASSPTKRRLTEISETTAGKPTPKDNQAVKKPAIRQNTLPTKSTSQRPTETGAIPLSKLPAVPGDTQHSAPHESNSRQSTVSGADDEAEVFTETRLLQAPNGRLIYLGDSATLSCLQILRFIVGEFEPCDFTNDPSRHKIMENVIDFDSNQELPGIIPPPQTAQVLLNSFFTNTHGLLDLFNRTDFERAAIACLHNPFIAKPGMLNLMYLNFATGLVLATPKAGEDDDAIVGRLRQSQIDVAENYFRSTQRHMDPLTLHEKGDFSSVQVLCLMAVYSLSVSRRNAAITYLAMAVQSAFTLGLHRGMQMQLIFSKQEQVVRRKVWRSLFVLDRFLAAALGRPTLIAEDDCSADSLEALQEELGEMPEDDRCMNLAVDIARLIGRILKTVYASRRVTTKLAQEFTAHSQKLEKQLQKEFHWDRAMDPSTPTIEAVAILHLNLFYSHAVLLYTRPFFLYLLKNDQVDKVPPTKFSQRMQRFSRTCVKIAERTIEIAQGAYHARYLPQRNPFVTHFLFAAALVILGNEFARLHPNPGYSRQLSNVLSIVAYCAQTDPQARRLTYILETFRDVVARRHRSQSADTERDPSRAVPYAVSPRDNVAPRSGRIPKIDTDRYKGPSVSDGLSTRTRVPVGSPMGYQPIIPALQEAPFSGPANGASPASSASYSLRGGDAMSGRRASDVNTPAGEDEVNLDALWQSAQGEAHISGVPLYPTFPTGQSKPMQSDAGSFGMYDAFLHSQGRPS